MEKDNGRIYWQLAVKIIVLIVFLIVLTWFLREISWVITLILISTLIVYAISPLADLLEKRNFSRTTATTITFLAFILFIIGFLFLTIPTLYNEIQALAEYAPILYRHLELDFYLEQLSLMIEGPELARHAAELFEALPQALEGIQELFLQLTQFSLGLITVFFEFLIVMFLVFYILRDIKAIKKGIISFFPYKYQKEADRILQVLDMKVGQYLRGNLVRCLLVGVLTGIGLFILDIRFFFMLGALAAVLNIIVYIGPYIAAFPAVLIALTYSLQMAVIVSLMYIAVQCIDAFVLTPVLLGKAVDLRPFSIIIALLIGGTIYGIVGILLSIPLVATLKVLINYYYFERKVD